MAAPLIMAGLSLAQGVAKWIGAGKQDKKLTGMVNDLGEYQADGDVAGNVATAKNLFNGRMAGGSIAEQNILGNQANIIDAIQRNSTDPSQVLATLAATQGQTDSSLVDLATAEGQNKQQTFGQLQNAVQLNNQEKKSVWADKIRKLNQIMSIKSTTAANKSDAGGDIVSGLAMGAQAFSDMKQDKDR